MYKSVNGGVMFATIAWNDEPLLPQFFYVPLWWMGIEMQLESHVKS